MQVFDDDALFLDSSAFRDADLVVSVLTHHHGLQRGVWRRARGTRSAAGAAAQVLSLVRLTAHHKAGAEMITCRQLELLRSSYPLATHFGAAAAAAVAAELLLNFCPMGEPAERRFRLGVAALDALLDGIDPATVVSYVQLWILVLSGVMPALDQCASCGAELRENPHIASTDRALVCHRCALPGHPALSTTDFGFLTACRRRPLGTLGLLTTARTSEWLDALTEDNAERRLRALSFFRTHAGGGNA